jgi:hypothetical protein
MLVALGLRKARLWTGFFGFENGGIRMIRYSVVDGFI